MRSKVHPKYKTKYRVGNWSAYEQALVQRGDVTLWLSADATDAWRLSVSNSSSGRRWKLDHAPAVGDPTHMVEFGTGRRAFAREA